MRTIGAVLAVLVVLGVVYRGTVVLVERRDDTEWRSLEPRCRLIYSPKRASDPQVTNWLCNGYSMIAREAKR